MKYTHITCSARPLGGFLFRYCWSGRVEGSLSESCRVGRHGVVWHRQGFRLHLQINGHSRPLRACRGEGSLRILWSYVSCGYGGAARVSLRWLSLIRIDSLAAAQRNRNAEVVQLTHHFPQQDNGTHHCPLRLFLSRGIVGKARVKPLGYNASVPLYRGLVCVVDASGGGVGAPKLDKTTKVLLLMQTSTENDRHQGTQVCNLSKRAGCRGGCEGGRDKERHIHAPQYSCRLHLLLGWFHPTISLRCRQIEL